MTSPKHSQRSGEARKPKAQIAYAHCRSKKVRYSGERPTCRRCAQRGAVCQYHLTRRLGRRRKDQRYAAPTSQPQDTGTLNLDCEPRRGDNKINHSETISSPQSNQPDRFVLDFQATASSSALSKQTPYKTSQQSQHLLTENYVLMSGLLLEKDRT